MISIVAFIYICAYCNVNSQGQVALAFVSIILIVPTTLLFLIYQRSIEKENELMKLKSEMDKAETEKTYYTIIEKQNQNLKSYADDVQNHLEAIKNLNSDPQIEEYINKMSERLTEYSSERK
jgi:predicted Zn-dependent protease